MTEETTSKFTDLLTQEFRWPTPGDRLFVPSEEYMGDATLEGDFLTRLVLMADGYKKAADLLVQKATDDRTCRDFLVYPIIFCYRHYLELVLKQTLALHGTGVGISSEWSSHDISMLWRKVVDMFRLYGVDDASKTDPVVAGCIAEFSKIDPGSFSFRYPTDTRGKPLPLSLERLDLQQLRDVMNGLSGYFTGVDGHLSTVSDAQP